MATGARVLGAMIAVMSDQNSRLVYSTDGGRVRPPADDPPRRASKQPRRGSSRELPADPGDGFVRLHRGTAARGGKARTLIVGLPGSDTDLDAVLKRYKRQIGAGGSREGRVLLLQGDQREKLQTLLEADGHRVKIAGG